MSGAKIGSSQHTGFYGTGVDRLMARQSLVLRADRERKRDQIAQAAAAICRVAESEEEIRELRDMLGLPALLAEVDAADGVMEGALDGAGAS